MYLRHSRFSYPSFVGQSPSRQQGVVLLIALIVLVALTLAGAALIRSVDTTNLIAGNMSFHQSAVHAGERSTEIAIADWLGPKSASGETALNDNSAANGYRAVRADPGAGVSWDAFWNSELNTQAVTGTTDAAGNTVSYVIHRLCDSTGAPHLVNCSKPPSGTNTGGSYSGGGTSITPPSQVYYRITTRIAGPRNTVAYIQTVIAI